MTRAARGWWPACAIAFCIVIGAGCLDAAAQESPGDRWPAEYYNYLDPWTFMHVEIGGSEGLHPHSFDQVNGHPLTFEPASAHPALKAITGPVGRLELQYKWNKDGVVSSEWCTAVLIARNLVLTAYHCYPGSRADFSIAAARVRFGYYAPGRKGDAYEVLSLFDGDAGLDFALLVLSGMPADKYGFVHARDMRAPQPGEALIVVHHPAAIPLRISATHCIVKDQDLPADQTVFNHSCDTLGGSSGAPIFSDDGHALVGIHHSSLTEAGQATLITAILEKSTALRNLLYPPQNAPPANAPTPLPPRPPQSTQPTTPHGAALYVVPFGYGASSLSATADGYLADVVADFRNGRFTSCDIVGYEWPSEAVPPLWLAKQRVVEAARRLAQGGIPMADLRYETKSYDKPAVDVGAKPTQVWTTVRCT